MIPKQVTSLILSIVLGVIVLSAIYLLDNFYVSQEPVKKPDPQNNDKCEILGGTFVNEYNECEWVSQEQCDSMGGTYNECASACRHNPEAEFCTLNCVQVCSLT